MREARARANGGVARPRGRPRKVIGPPVPPAAVEAAAKERAVIEPEGGKLIQLRPERGVPTASRATKLRMAEFEKLIQRRVGPHFAARAVGWSDQMFRQIKKTYRPWYDATMGRVSPEDVIPGLAERYGEDVPAVPGLVEFRKEAFGLDTFWHMQEIINHLEDEECRRLLLLLPPEHAKTTIVGRDWPSWLACKERWMVAHQIPHEPMRFAVVSETSGYAKTLGWQLRTDLSDVNESPWMHERWGPFEGAYRWSEEEVYFGWRTAKEKDPSMQWKGWKNQLQGPRLTHLLLDDAVSPQTGESDQKKITTKFDHTYQRRLGKRGRAAVTGNRAKSNDLYSTFRRRAAREGSPWHEVVLAALNEKGEPIWPEMFSAAYFEAVRAEMEDDPLYFLVFQQVESLGKAAVFDPNSLEADKHHGLGLHDRHQGGVTICGLDPSQDGGWAATAASWKMDSDPRQQNIRALDTLMGDRGGHDQMVEAVDWMLGFNPDHIAIEKQGGMALFIGQELEDKILSANCELHLVPTTGQALTDQEYGMSALASWVRREQVQFPWSEGARHAISPLIDDMLRYHPSVGLRHLHRLSSFWFIFWCGVQQYLPAVVQSFGTGVRQAPWIKAQQRSIPIVRVDEPESD